MTRPSCLSSLLNGLIKSKDHKVSTFARHLIKSFNLLIQSLTCSIFYFVSIKSFAKTAGGHSCICKGDVYNLAYSPLLPAKTTIRIGSGVGTKDAHTLVLGL